MKPNTKKEIEGKEKRIILMALKILAETLVFKRGFGEKEKLEIDIETLIKKYET